MADPAPAARTFATLEDWVARESIPFAVDSPDLLNAAVDRLIASLRGSVQLLGLGEPTHMVELFLDLRNRIFQRLVQAHGYTAIAIESSFPRGHIVNDYVTGTGASASYA